MRTGEDDIITIRDWGLHAYEPVWHAMSQYTDQRDAHSPDQLWLVEHPPVFTQGQAGKAEHLLDTGDIPVVQVDRGGQVTYHGPGQLVIYPLIDISRRRLGSRDLVQLIERALISTLAAFDISAEARPDAPGVYTEQGKIASLGLRIRRGCSFHGLALNINLDLAPFLRINPCGYAGMAMTRLCDISPDIGFDAVKTTLCHHLITELSYNPATAPSVRVS